MRLKVLFNYIFNIVPFKTNSSYFGARFISWIKALLFGKNSVLIMLYYFVISYTFLFFIPFATRLNYC